MVFLLQTLVAEIHIKEYSNELSKGLAYVHVSHTYCMCCACPSACHAHTQDGICSKFCFILGAIQRVKKLIDLFLVRGHVQLAIYQLWRDDLVDV